MSHAYDEVWSQAQRLQPAEQLQLLEDLAGLLRRQLPSLSLGDIQASEAAVSPQGFSQWEDEFDD